MRRALANFASRTLRGEFVDSFSSRCLATSVEPSSRRSDPKAKRVTEEDRIGVKSKLYHILKQSSQPLSSAEIFEAAEPMGVKSKRFMKQMLQHMKQARYIKTMKTGKGTQMGFILPENMNPQGKGVPWPLAPVSSPAADEESSQDAA